MAYLSLSSLLTVKRYRLSAITSWRCDSDFARKYVAFGIDFVAFF